MGAYVALLLDVAKGAFADRADIRVHLASGDAECPKGKGKRPADRDRHAHLIPAAPADAGAVMGRREGRGSRHVLQSRRAAEIFWWRANKRLIFNRLWQLEVCLR
ncbi:hypothetical protein D3C86_1813470 [compost metagenome]